MTKEVSISIRDDGSLVFLKTPDAEFLRDLGRCNIKRASNVEPENKVLRALFYMLRYMFGDYGFLAAFTRVWPCIWRVNIIGDVVPEPIILPSRWRNRQEAIDAEVKYINEHII